MLIVHLCFMTTETITQDQGWTLEEKMKTVVIGTFLLHPAVVLTGMYQGFQASNGNTGTSHPIFPLLIANTLGSAYCKAEDQLEKYAYQRRVVTGKVQNLFASMEEHQRMTKQFLKNAGEDAIKGSIIGAIITPVEYLVGWGTGMAIGRINEVFS